MISQVFSFLFSLEPLSAVLLAVMVVLFVAGGVFAYVHRRSLDSELERAKHDYMLDPKRTFATRVDPLAYIKLHLNEHSAERIIESVPGLLVTMGILGTFLGLGLAIGSASEAMSADAAKGAVALKTLLTTIAIKFQVSAWGILLSFVFTVAVKLPTVRRVEFRVEAVARELMDAYSSAPTELAQIGSSLENAVHRALAPVAGALQAPVEHLRAELAEQLPKIRNATTEMASASKGLSSLSRDINGALGKMNADVTKTIGDLGASLRDMLANVSRVLEEGAARQQQASAGREKQLDRSLAEMEKFLKAALETSDRYANELNSRVDSISSVMHSFNKHFADVLRLTEELNRDSSMVKLDKAAAGIANERRAPAPSAKQPPSMPRHEAREVDGDPAL